MFNETVSLILKHADINTDTTLDSVSNSVGSWSNEKQSSDAQIIIDLFRSFSDVEAQYGVEKLPHMCFSFNIYPVKIYTRVKV